MNCTDGEGIFDILLGLAIAGDIVSTLMLLAGIVIFAIILISSIKITIKARRAERRSSDKAPQTYSTTPSEYDLQPKTNKKKDDTFFVSDDTTDFFDIDSQICPACGSKLSGKEKFCENCGHKIKNRG